jgi:V8-like Glu-specific endopeptidase
MTDAAALAAMIRCAEAEGDRTALERIAAILRRHGAPVQREGEMAPRLPLTEEGRAALGLAPEGAEEGSPAIALANRVAQAIRRVEFLHDRRTRPDLPTVLAEGDSWFLHPLVTDTLDHLRREAFNVRSLAAAGDTAAAMLGGAGPLDALARGEARALLLSAGGNDLLGEGRIAGAVHPEDPERAPDALVDWPAYEQLLCAVIARYRATLSRLARARPEVRVFAHGYDHPARVEAGPWIWPPLARLGYTPARARDVVAVLLDRFNAALAALSREAPNLVHLDMRGVVGPRAEAWHDAIHPDGAGFGRVAEVFADAVERFLAGSADRATSGAARPSPRPGPALARPHERVARGFDARLGDLEWVRALVREMPPERDWPAFADPQVRAHIRDVLRLLGDAVAVPPPPAAPGPRAFAEAFVGRDGLEPVRMLLAGYEAGRAVGRVQIVSPQGMHVGHGSGFLVAPGLFLTNAHVLPDAETAARSAVVFGDEATLDGALPHPERVEITAEVFLASEALDYALVSLAPESEAGRPLAAYGRLPLGARGGDARRFEPVSIIQHPGGGPKAIAMRSSVVMGRAGDGLYYTTDTSAGSSGAPVLDRDWQVVALHHRAVPHPTMRGAVLANRGVPIPAIRADLEARAARGEAPAAQALADLGTAEGGAPAAARAAPLRAAGPEAAPAGPADLPARIGAQGRRFILEHEVSSRAHYEARLRAPVVPGGRSGVTIGIGYDIGQRDAATVRADWAGLLEPAALDRLAACAGLRGPAARARLPALEGVRVSFDAAREVFERVTLPEACDRLAGAMPEGALDSLPGPCLAALVSLTFNRGSSFRRQGARYREMREICSAIAAGEPERVPGLLRSMTRLWEGRPGLRGLLRRREAEAALFESGLAAAPLPPPRPA